MGRNTLYLMIICVPVLREFFWFTFKTLYEVQIDSKNSQNSTDWAEFLYFETLDRPSARSLQWSACGLSSL